LEGGYVDLGETVVDLTLTDGVQTATVHAKAESEGFTLAAVGIAPVRPRFSVFGKVGAYFADTDGRISAAGPAGVLATSSDASETEVLVGVGASFALLKNVSLRIEYERYDDVGDDDEFGEADIDLASASVSIGF